MKVTITLTKQEAIEALLRFYKHTGATEIVILDDDELSTENEWISNIGWVREGHPGILDFYTRIEVKYRNDENDTGRADKWESNWKETDGHPRDIVAYRVL